MTLRSLCFSALLGGTAVALTTTLPLFLPSAQATVAIALGLDDLVHKADQVVVADVVTSQAAWDARHETIVTTVELAVVESWKGDAAPAKHITFQQPGGTVGDITMTVSGLSSFTPGERSLVFLRKIEQSLTVVGLSQGKRPMRSVPVADGSAKTQWMVSPPHLAGLATVKNAKPTAVGGSGSSLSASTPATPVNAADVRGPVSLDEMRARVRALLQNEAK